MHDGILNEYYKYVWRSIANILTFKTKVICIILYHLKTFSNHWSFRQSSNSPNWMWVMYIEYAQGTRTPSFDIKRPGSLVIVTPLTHYTWIRHYQKYLSVKLIWTIVLCFWKTDKCVFCKLKNDINFRYACTISKAWQVINSFPSCFQKTIGVPDLGCILLLRN